MSKIPDTVAKSCMLYPINRLFIIIDQNTSSITPVNAQTKRYVPINPDVLIALLERSAK